MNYDTAKFWFDILQTVLIAVVGFQNYLSKKQSATVASIERLEDDLGSKMENQNVRLARVEQDMNHVPTHDDLGKIHEKLNETNNNLNRLTGEITGEFKYVRNALDRMYQNALDKK